MPVMTNVYRVEFFCQHPRWHQKGRYDQKKKHATKGNKPPCSLYMRHSTVTNTTLYIIAAPEDGDWFSFVDRIRLGPDQGDPSGLAPGELAASPFMLHAIVASISFEQATDYAVDVRDRLMTQASRVCTSSQGHPPI